MILSINLKDEPAFLDEIKKFIMEHVKGIARNEFEKQIKQVFSEKLNSSFPKEYDLKYLIEKLTKEELQKLIKEALVNGSYSTNERDGMRKIIREEITKQVKELFDKKDY